MTAPRRQAVLVAGPSLAGTSSLVAALRRHSPHLHLVEDLRAGEVAAVVVFAVSAAAPIAGSDCRLLDRAAADTDAVVGVLTKIDVHRGWRETLEADRALATAHRDRYADMSWVGVSVGIRHTAEVGAAGLDELAAVLDTLLANGGIDVRNRLCSKESRLEAEILRYEQAVAGADRRDRETTLRAARTGLLTGRRRARPRRSAALNGRLREARVELSRLSAGNSTRLRLTLQRRAAELPRRAMAGFAGYAAGQVALTADVLAAETDRRLADIACELALPDPGAAPDGGSPVDPDLPDVLDGPPEPAGGLEARLTVLLGLGFGSGVAVTLTRLVAFLPVPGHQPTVVGVTVGLAVACWMVVSRRLLTTRAVLQRWSAEMTVRLRADLDHVVAARLLAAETAWSAQLAAEEDAELQRVAERLAAVDAELAALARDHGRVRRERERMAPQLRRALDGVRRELGRAGPAAADCRRVSGPAGTSPDN